VKSLQENLISLWQTSLYPLSFRKPVWVLETFWLPILVLLLSVAISDFDKNMMLSYGILGGVISVISLVIYIVLLLIVSRRLLNKYTYQSTLLLYITFDAIMLAAVGLSFLFMGLSVLSKYSVVSNENYETIKSLVFTYLLISSVVMLVVSPKIILSKHGSKHKQYGRDDKKITIARVLAGSVPGVGLIIFSFFSTSDVFLTNLEVGLLFFLGFFVILIAIPNFYLVGLLVKNKWPKIIKSGSEFIVMEDNNGE
jgi:hypothetical protein